MSLYNSKFETGADIDALLDAINFQLIVGTALPATTGAMTATMDGGRKALTPTGNCTLNATGGAAGQLCTLFVATTGTTSYTLTFGTNFKSAGALATGTVSGKLFTVTFRYDGTNWCEISRTTAM